MRMLSLFSGIGGLDLAAQWAGIETVAFCEIEPFCQRVLAKHWPGVPIFDDVTKLTVESLRAAGVERVDVVAGGFPCQDISVANPAGKGIEGTRSGLWREMFRILCELRPPYVVLENVPNLLNRGAGRVLGDMASVGYDAQWDCLPAADAGAPHLRERIWIVAYPGGTRRERLVEGFDSRPPGPWRMRGEADLLALAHAPFQPGDSWPQPLLRRMDDGLSRRVDRLGALGNSVVPQVAYPLFKAIVEIESSGRQVGGERLNGAVGEPHDGLPVGEKATT